MFTSLKRIFKLGWKSFFRDGGLAAATVFILVLAISLATSLFLFRELSQFLISALEEKADISVYFKEEVPEIDILEIKEELAKVSEVKEIKYVSKEKALAEFVQRHEKNPVLMASLEAVGRNPFLASLNIMALEPGYYQTIVNFFEKLGQENLVEKVDYYQRKPVIEAIFSLTSAINRAFLFLSVILAVLAILITFNTIRLAIYNSGEEIKIQRLVGASNWFIRGPFLVQGTISGIFAALICLLVFSLIIWGLSPKIETLFPSLNIFQFFVSNFWQITSIQFATGILLGVISSGLATRRYLKV
ncbi:MAG: permease-like cell division protein FtsX [Patescibacteria group bacterium]|nr:permease-like cell division protein FtsX [Patescibacteria group bacterium]